MSLLGLNAMSQNVFAGSTLLASSAPIISGAEKFGLPLCDPGAETQKIIFVHRNDVHASYIPEANGGNPYARHQGYYESIRDANPGVPVIKTNAGDDYEKGSVAEHKSKGVVTREVHNIVRPHLTVIGNHDFAFGPDEFLAYTRYRLG